MIVSDSFIQSEKARDSDFTTNYEDRPLIVQFAAKNADDLSAASQLVYPYADGVDINCGCPQRWAMHEGYGACLLSKPQLLVDMVQQTRARISDDQFTVSIKIRIHDDLKHTVELCRRAVHAGVSWITVHGRTPEQRGQPVNLSAISHIRQSVSVPVIANGDIKSLEDVKTVCEQTCVQGVMSARGILSNPAMFSGYNHTPLQCVADWVDISLRLGTSFQSFHNHLMFMLENITSKSDKRVFNSLSSITSVLDYLSTQYGLQVTS